MTYKRKSFILWKFIVQDCAVALIWQAVIMIEYVWREEDKADREAEIEARQVHLNQPTSRKCSQRANAH